MWFGIILLATPLLAQMPEEVTVEGGCAHVSVESWKRGSGVMATKVTFIADSERTFERIKISFEAGNPFAVKQFWNADIASVEPLSSTDQMQTVSSVTVEASKTSGEGGLVMETSSSCASSDEGECDDPTDASTIIATCVESGRTDMGELEQERDYCDLRNGEVLMKIDHSWSAGRGPDHQDSRKGMQVSVIVEKWETGEDISFRFPADAGDVSVHNVYGRVNVSTSEQTCAIQACA